MNLNYWQRGEIKNVQIIISNQVTHVAGGQIYQNCKSAYAHILILALETGASNVLLSTQIFLKVLEVDFQGVNYCKKTNFRLFLVVVF